MNKELSSFEGNTAKAQRDTLTPYKIAVVIFIKLYCDETVKPKVVIENIEKRNFCVASLKLIQSPDMDVTTLFNTFTGFKFILPRLRGGLQTELENLCTQGVKGLLDLFDSLGFLMKPSADISHVSPPLSKHSVLGLYIRRVIMLFERLTFYQIVMLFESFKQYVKEKDNIDKTVHLTGKFKKDEPKNHNKNAWGGRQAELFVAQQAHALQTDEHKALPPSELQALVQTLLCPYYAEAHYLSYLNCLRVNEYCGALDSLYHCFDRLARLENRPASDDRLRTFRYAALNLAALHAHFNHKHAAKFALKEAIMMAQEAGDNVCLQLAQAWIYHLATKRKGPLIERSIEKAIMLGITHTPSLALISLAHNLALEGEKPQHVFETLMKSDVLNCKYSMVDLMSVIYAEKTALWAYYGKTEMSSVCAQLLLLHNSGEKKQQMFNGPSTCQAVVNVANILVEFGEYCLASVILSHAKDRFPNQPSSKVWMLSEQLHELTQMMWHEQWSTAEDIASRISSLDPLESKFRLAEVCLAKGEYPRGLQLISDIEKMPGITPQHKIRAMILSSQMTCSSILPGTGIAATNSLVHLNAALEMAVQNHLSYYGALVKMYLANVQLLMGMPFQASRLVEEAIIQILAHGGSFDQGRALVLYAKTSLATCASTNEEERILVIQEAAKNLSKARKHFEKIEAFGRIKSTVHLLSNLYHELDMKDERNKCAFEFRQLEQQFPTKLDTVSIY